MKLNPAFTALVAAMTLTVAGAAHASPVWEQISPTTSPITLTGTNGNPVKVGYSPSPAETIWYYDGNIHNQSAANILNVVNTQFGLASGVLHYVSGCDSANSNCTDASDGQGGQGYSNEFTSKSNYNYLAVHFGQGELLFHWATPIAANSPFKINIPCGLGGLSNYRAYDAPSPTPTPLPPAALLFASAIIGLLLTKNRRI